LLLGCRLASSRPIPNPTMPAPTIKKSVSIIFLKPADSFQWLYRCLFHPLKTISNPTAVMKPQEGDSTPGLGTELTSESTISTFSAILHVMITVLFFSNGMAGFENRVLIPMLN
jgi:hypothetical protein